MTFNNKINLLVIDVLYIVHHLGLTQRVGSTMIDIISDDIHHKTSMIKSKIIERALVYISNYNDAV